MATALEPRLSLPPGSVRPLARATRCESAVINDRASNRCHVLGADDPALLSAVKASIAQAAPAAAPQFPAEISEDDPGRFLAQVARVIEYIRAGDVYQLNLSRRWQIREQQPADAAALFAALRQRNAAPFATLARWPDLEIISASPERLFRVRDGRIDTRPIAGTRPRHGAADADQKALAALIAHPKERAEHIMLIDLERNDLGRICRTGTVEVDELLGLESYATVHHIVSNVHGELRPDIGIDAILRAVFPGGTITGCPKIRCMEIITELEGRARGAYTGSVGYISDDGQMDFNILIRTLVREAGALRIDAGAGIVADSEPARELAETRAKAAGMLQIFSGTGP